MIRGLRYDAFMEILSALRSTGLANERVIPAGIQLWGDGDDAGELGLVVEGELVARVGEAELGRIRRGELVGEAAAWFGGRRTAEVAAVTETRLLVIQRSALETLRDGRPQVYDKLLEAGVFAMARRVRDVDLDIARRASGTQTRPDRGEPSWWKQLIESIRGSEAGDAPPVEGTLRMLPSLKGCPSAVMLALKKAMKPRSYTKGEAVFLQGDEGRNIYLLSAGRVDVLRNVRGDKAVPLACLGPGGLFGTGASVLSERRNANCVVGSDFAWVYELDREGYATLDIDARRAWNEALMDALRIQLATADDQLAALERDGKQPQAEDYDRIRGLLRAYQGR